MLTPEEIKAKLILKKIKQSEIAAEAGITRSQLSTIINVTGLVIERLTEILGENPFEIEAPKD